MEKDGTKKRSITFKELPAGKYKVKVRAYCVTDYREYSEFSKEKAVTLKQDSEIGKGYKKSYDFSKLEEGDTIFFGSYEQDNKYSNGYEPIEWIVLSKTDTQVFLLSKYVLDVFPYNKIDPPGSYSSDHDAFGITWAECTLREWLNEKFYKIAFNKTERKMIKKVLIKNEDNAETGIDGGIDTYDRIFLLSISEISDSKYGFDDDNSRVCEPTEYVKNYINDSSLYDSENNTYQYWLRSPGIFSNKVTRVETGGRINWWNDNQQIYLYGVRPALIIDLK